MNIYTIYRATNTINNKCYVGFTSQKLSRRISAHKYNCLTKKIKNKLYNAIRFYGWDNFFWEPIYHSLEYSHTLNVMESYFIDENNSIENGYNTTKGGEGITGFSHSEKTINKMKKSHGIRLERQGKVCRDHSKRVPKQSEEYSDKMRKLASGKKHFFNPETGHHTMAHKCPPGYIEGIGTKSKNTNKKWYHCPLTRKSTLSFDCPTGYKLGRC